MIEMPDPEAAGPIPDDDLAAMRARVDAATPPPWSVELHDHIADGCRCMSCFETVGALVDTPKAAFCDDLRPGGCSTGPLLDWADADFAVHAREDMPRLLDEVERLRAQLAGRENR